jgi:hypothetical protein
VTVDGRMGCFAANPTTVAVGVYLSMLGHGSWPGDRWGNLPLNPRERISDPPVIANTGAAEVLCGKVLAFLFLLSMLLSMSIVTKMNPTTVTFGVYISMLDCESWPGDGWGHLPLNPRARISDPPVITNTGAAPTH